MNSNRIRLAILVGLALIALTTLLIERQKISFFFGRRHSASEARYQDLLRPWLSADGQHMVYVAKITGTSRVMVDGREQAGYVGDIAGMVLSADASHIACLIQGGDRWRMIHDGRKQPVYDEIRTPVLSPDGKHVAYAARQGDHWRLLTEPCAE